MKCKMLLCIWKWILSLYDLFYLYSQNAGAKEKEITRYAQETLLIGLADSDPAIRWVWKFNVIWHSKHVIVFIIDMQIMLLLWPCSALNGNISFCSKIIFHYVIRINHKLWNMFAHSQISFYHCSFWSTIQL